MEPHSKSKHRVLNDESGMTLSYCCCYLHCATAYAISPVVARAFVYHSRVLTAPVDKFIKNFWLHRQPLYVMHPNFVRAGSLRKYSSIEPDRASIPNPSFCFRILRQLYKAKHSVYKTMFNMSMLKKHKISDIPFARNLKSDYQKAS
jgi:GR25 family glycosyltransferase involved in LPS biosynthesis